MNKNRKYILILLGVLILSTLFIGINYLMKLKDKPLPDVELNKETNKKKFAIMVQNETKDGYVEYTSEDGTWPSEEYEFKEAKCIDNNGSLVNNAVTFNNGKVTVKTNKTIYCTMYFDKKPETIKILREKDTQGYLSEKPVPEDGGMYRYQAAFPDSDSSEMTNWICFGTKDQSACKNDIDKYMYRIIGITEDGQMYLIKETFLKEGSTTGFAWNTAYRIDSGSGVNYCSGGVCPEWNEADLFKRINGTANGKTSGDGYSTHADTDIFVDSSQYDYIKSGDSNGTNDGKGNEWYNLIEDHEWMYGDIGDSTPLNTYNGNTLYAIETGNAETKHYFGPYGNSPLTPYTWPATNKVKAKISLMYVHDYYLAYPAGIPGSSSNAQKSWIFFQKDGYNTSQSYEWLSTRWGGNSGSYVLALLVRSDGYCFSDLLLCTFGGRPVFYLSSRAKIVDGEGTKASPYTLA